MEIGGEERRDRVRPFPHEKRKGQKENQGEPTTRKKREAKGRDALTTEEKDLGVLEGGGDRKKDRGNPDVWFWEWKRSRGSGGKANIRRGGGPMPCNDERGDRHGKKGHHKIIMCLLNLNTDERMKKCIRSQRAGEPVFISIKRRKRKNGQAHTTLLRDLE